MTDERYIKLQEVMQNETVLCMIAECKSANELQSVLNRYGVKYSDEEAATIYETMRKQSASDELSENDLEAASGGIGLLTAVGIVAGLYIAGRIYGYFASKQLPNYCL